MCLAAYLVENSAIAALTEGLITVDERMRTLAPLAVISASFSLISLSTLSQVAACFLASGVLKRAESYKPSTEACIRAFKPPLVTEDEVLPSNLIGRPSLVFTRTLP